MPKMYLTTKEKKTNNDCLRLVCIVTNHMEIIEFKKNTKSVVLRDDDILM